MIEYNYDMYKAEQTRQERYFKRQADMWNDIEYNDKSEEEEQEKWEDYTI